MTLFVIGVSLTEAGMAHIEDVAAVVFQYLALLRNSRDLCSVWEDSRRLTALRFRFQEPVLPAPAQCLRNTGAQGNTRGFLRK